MRGGTEGGRSWVAAVWYECAYSWGAGYRGGRVSAR